MSQWYLYLVRNKHGQLYTGITTNVERRFSEHCKNGLRCAKALRGKGPLELKYSSPAGTYSEALRAEAKIKKRPKAHKERLILEQLPLKQWLCSLEAKT